MSGKRSNDRPNDMPPGKRINAETIATRYLPRDTKLNETGKIEWLYRRTYQHGKHSGTASNPQ